MKKIKVNMVAFDGGSENGIKALIEIELSLQEQRERIQTFCTSEVIEYLRSEHKFAVRDIVEVCSISNVSEEKRKGKWVFVGDFYGVPEKEKWLWKNQEALGQVKKGLEQAAKGEFVESPIEPKSVQRRKKIQKKEE